MTGLFVVMTSSWHNCLLRAWEVKSIQFEYHAVIKFLLKEVCNATAIHQHLVTMYGDSALNYCTVTRWFKEFTHGHQSLEDDFRSGWSLDAVKSISIATAEKLIMTNRKVKVTEIPKNLHVLTGSTENIVHIVLHMLKVSSHWYLKISMCTIGINAWLHVKTFWICMQGIKKSSVVVW